MWYALDIDEGLIGSYLSKRIAMEKLGNILRTQRLDSGVYQVITGYEGEDHTRTTYLFKSRELAKKHGFDWVIWRRRKV